MSDICGAPQTGRTAGALDEQKAPEGNSIPCPQCGCATSCVKNSRKRHGAIHRRRDCANGHRFGTVERIVRDARAAEQHDILVAYVTLLSPADYATLLVLAKRLTRDA